MMFSLKIWTLGGLVALGVASPEQHAPPHWLVELAALAGPVDPYATALQLGVSVAEDQDD